MEKFEIEIIRHNITPAKFLGHIRRKVDEKGGQMLRGDLGLEYFKRGDDLNFDIKHDDGTHEKSISKPYEMQTYIKGKYGIYNEICEFNFDDNQRGTGYYYLLNIIES